MSHNLDMTNGRANIAFLGSRNDVWHRMGQEMVAGQSIEEWSKAAGLGWSAVKVPAVVALSGDAWDHIPAEKRFLPAPNRSFIVRDDNAGLLGYVSGETDSEGYQMVQPREVLDWFDKYIQVDDRFKLDVCGSLDGGRRIWATAKYCGDVSVAGESHAMRVLMSTTYDASGATINQATATRAVCQNTIRIAHSDTRAQIKTRHSTKFDAAKVGRELAQLAQGRVVQAIAQFGLPHQHDLQQFAVIRLQIGQEAHLFEKIVGETLASINPNLTIVKFQTFQKQIDDRFTEERMIARLTSLFGLLALLLAAIGLYGVTAHTVVRRTTEIGIRMALGAARTRVIGTVVRGAMLQAVTGLAIGVPLAIFCVRYVKSQLYEITSVSVPVMAVAIAVLVCAAAIAGFIPALRAASIDPVRALRAD